MPPASIAIRPAAHLDPACPGAPLRPSADRRRPYRVHRADPRCADGQRAVPGLRDVHARPARGGDLDKRLCAILGIAPVTAGYLEEALRGAYSPFRAGGGARSLRLRSRIHLRSEPAMGPASGEVGGGFDFTVAREYSVRLRCTSAIGQWVRWAAMVRSPTRLGWGALAEALALGDDHRAGPT